MVVINWSPAAAGLVRALARATADAPDSSAPVICVGTDATADVEEALSHVGPMPPLRYVEAPMLAEGLDRLAQVLRDEVQIAAARSVIVLPDSHAEEPDAASRLTCAAVGRACDGRAVPNILVEVEDPEAAYEFAGLGVATVFYPGYLRAALLAHACVDLGVFQFVYGLLRGRYRVRLWPVPIELRGGTFVEAACEVEEDDRGRPITTIGLQLPPPTASSDGTPASSAIDATGACLVINPGPRQPLRDALGLLVLVDP